MELWNYYIIQTFAVYFRYISAVLRQDVVPVFPYISDTGTWPPESCFFGIMLTIGAIFCKLFHNMLIKKFVVRSMKLWN